MVQYSPNASGASSWLSSLPETDRLQLYGPGDNVITNSVSRLTSWTIHSCHRGVEVRRRGTMIDIGSMSI